MTIVLNSTTGISTPPVTVLGDTSGSISIVAPAVAGTNTQTLLAATGTLSPFNSDTAKASTSGTSVEFTGIPSWVRRVTIMFSGVSTNSTNPIQVQIGSGSYTTSGYISTSGRFSTTANTTNSIVGFIVTSPAGTDAISGNLVLTNLTSNTWVASFSGKASTTACCVAGGDVSLSGALDRLRIIGSTTGLPTDTFDAGSINLLYE